MKCVGSKVGKNIYSCRDDKKIHIKKQLDRLKSQNANKEMKLIHMALTWFKNICAIQTLKITTNIAGRMLFQIQAYAYIYTHDLCKQRNLKHRG